jgi:hypothetical protein
MLDTTLYYWHRTQSNILGLCTIQRSFLDSTYIVKFEGGKFMYVNGDDLQTICQSCHMPSCDCP